MVNREFLIALKSAGVLTSLDIHFSRFMERLNGKPSLELSLAAALLSSVTRRGHICLDLAQPGEACSPDGPGRAPAMACPPPEQWRVALRGCSVVGHPGDFTPLVLENEGRLYLFRYWDYQHRLAQGVLERVSAPVTVGEKQRSMLQGLLTELFPASSHGREPDWQMIAAFTAATRKFCVISGGPGTGKTTTVARILFLLAGMARPRPLRIALAAPTGKAAARLQEALEKARLGLPQEADVLSSIPRTASTLHRLLGSVLHSPYFRHHSGNPLPVDVVVVDEASMVDLALMSKLVQALPPKARLILLGDKDQLSSVEAGAVLGDICDSGEPLDHSPEFLREIGLVCSPSPSPGAGPLPESGAGPRSKRKPKDGIIQLRKSYRFKGESGIAALSEAVRDRLGNRALEILRDGAYPDVRWLKPGGGGGGIGTKLKELVEDGYGIYFDAVGRLGVVRGGEENGALSDLFENLDRFRILCALREGPQGVAGFNERVEWLIRERGWADTRRRWYVGRPVMIRTNDHQLGLFNGDIGICLPDAGAGGDLRVFFPAENGRFRSHHVLRLPEHDTVYAMTVHKSQGSEFDQVFLVLPHKDSPVLTRELVYTAITRARQRIVLRTSENIFQAAVSRETRRLSGLSDALWKKGD